MITCTKKKRMHFQFFFFLYFVKFQNLAVLAGQYCSNNAKNSPFQAFRWWGARSVSPSRPTSFLLPVLVCSQILLREINVDVWVWGRSLEVWAVLYKQYSRSPKRYPAHKIPFWGDRHFECIKGRLKKMVIVEHFPLSRCQSNAYEYGTRQMASFDDVTSLFPAQTNAP